MTSKLFNETCVLLKNYIKQERFICENEVRIQSNHNKTNTVLLSKGDRIKQLYEKIKDCKKCPLHLNRIKLVFGTGNIDATLMFIGEGPGFDEDRQGEPFVGKAGQLLTKIINAINMSRDKVYITNIVKCHPLKDTNSPEKRGNDRPPQENEINSCLYILQNQINIIKPKIICALGSVATKTLLKTTKGIDQMRGRFYLYDSEISIIPTYHPAALLRNPDLKRPVWEDMKMILKKLESDYK